MEIEGAKGRGSLSEKNKLLGAIEQVVHALLALQGLFEVGNRLAQRCITTDASLDQFACMHHRAVVAAAK